MKTINNISIIAVLAISGLSSCSKDTPADPLLVDNSFTQSTPTALTGVTALADTKVKSTDLPQTILDYVVTNYPNATISKSEVEDNGNYEVKLDDGNELIFGADGTFLGIDDDTSDDFGDTVVDLATLPQPITDYIVANHTDLAITSASMENNGHYEVELSDGSELVFDGNGAFLGIGVDENESSDTEDGNGTIDEDQNDGDSEDEDGTVIDATTLPQLVKDYISTTYTDASIVEARSTVDGGYEVELSTGMEVIFDANGSFVKTEDEGVDDGDNQNGNQHEDGTVIEAATLPQLIKDYLSTNYPDATIVEARSMTDGGFEVELSTKIEVVFDANGSFVKTEDGSTEDGD
ncbi:PepSY-like domain-containing protein [Maribacter sp.]|nr:PepSY-like domain-containing protein [Maribacter sp.]